jgi:NADH-quinone oxidoreductase subunit F
MSIVTLVHRVLHPNPIISLEDHVHRGGGKGLSAALEMTPEAIIERVLASGLRGRGGAGFPVGRKWQTVSQNRMIDTPSAVIVNAAEGEPGTFKDRTILRRNPYVVLEGALIAARAVQADLVVVGMKRSFAGEVERVRAAIEEIEHAEWNGDVTLQVFEGPDEYLYGEESALLETIDGRFPFPRVVPTFRRGLREAPEDAPIAPALVNNTESLANVPRIVARGPEWFRTVGTKDSPGTMVCTVTGRTQRHGVGEVLMGTPLRDVIEEIGGGPLPGREIKAVLSGVATGIIPGDLLDTPVTYEDLAAIGSGLGSGAFIVFDDTVDMVAVAAGAARFLAVESCGQCSPCKLDGENLTERLIKVSESVATEFDMNVIRKRIGTVADRSRCYLATQQQVLLESLLKHFPEDFQGHITNALDPVEFELIAELIDIRGGRAYLDERHRQKQYDWSYAKNDSGTVPVERFVNAVPAWRA